MDDDRLIASLPDALAAALRLRRAGEADDVVATALGIPLAGVAAVLELAEAKLMHLSQASAGAAGHVENQ
jgi:hypothetical protein